MRQLKTPKKIMTQFTEDGECPDLTYSHQDVEQMIIAAQRDALECAKQIVNDVSDGHTTYEEACSIFRHLMPKEK